MGWGPEDLEALKPGDISWLILSPDEVLGPPDSLPRRRGRPVKQPNESKSPYRRKTKEAPA
jgi:hypothetical protein